jgi:hypothetical protein
VLCCLLLLLPQIVGDGFCEDVTLRRRALDISFTAMMREAADAERARVRINKLSCTCASPAAATAAGAASAPSAASLTAASGALVLAGHYNHHGTAGAGQQGGDAAAKGLWVVLATATDRTVVDFQPQGIDSIS